MNKNIIIFYVPGAMGSFVSWMLERFNTLRTDVIDNPLTNNGSSHGYASLCSVESIDSRWNKMKEVSSMGRGSLKYNDPKFIEISVNELLNSTPDRLLSVLPLVGFDIRDKELFSAVLQEQREKQPSYE